MIRLSENFRALFYTPFYAAHAIGAYATEGVAVDLISSLDPARTAADLRAGRIDVMWGGPLRVLLAHAADPAADVVCFCDVVARDPFFLIGRAPGPAFRPADLIGPRIGIVAEVPTPWLCLQDDIRHDGADPAAANRAQGPSMAENAAALRPGRLDAVQLFQPHAEALLQDGFHLWHAAAGRGLTAYTTLVTRRSLLALRRDEMAAMVRAMHRVLRWIAATPGAEIARAVASFFPDVPAPRSSPPRSTATALSGFTPPTRARAPKASPASMPPCAPAARWTATSRSMPSSTTPSPERRSLSHDPAQPVVTRP